MGKTISGVAIQVDIQELNCGLKKISDLYFKELQKAVKRYEFRKAIKKLRKKHGKIQPKR